MSHQLRDIALREVSATTVQIQAITPSGGVIIKPDKDRQAGTKPLVLLYCARPQPNLYGF